MLRPLLLSIAFLFLCCTSSFADFTNHDTRYTQLKLFIINKTTFPVLLKLVNSEGVFEKPFYTGTPVILNPNDHYENTLTGIKRNDDIETFISVAVYDVTNTKRNYLIFSETGDLRGKFLSADIFDGLGRLFVDSNTNGCHALTPEGYAYCTLELKDAS